MTNLSDRTRLQLVLDALIAAGEDGVLTADLENAAVGGTAGTARARELRRKGHKIDAVPVKDTSQFRYIYRGGPDGSATPAPKPNTPFVFWKRSRRSDAFSASFNDCDLWAAQAWAAWVWRVAGPDGLLASGTANDEADAKQQAISAAREKQP